MIHIDGYRQAEKNSLRAAVLLGIDFSEQSALLRNILPTQSLGNKRQCESLGHCKSQKDPQTVNSLYMSLFFDQKHPLYHLKTP